MFNLGLGLGSYPIAGLGGLGYGGLGAPLAAYPGALGAPGYAGLYWIV